MEEDPTAFVIYLLLLVFFFLALTLRVLFPTLPTISVRVSLFSFSGHFFFFIYLKSSATISSHRIILCILPSYTVHTYTSETTSKASVWENFLSIPTGGFINNNQPTSVLPDEGLQVHIARNNIALFISIEWDAKYRLICFDCSIVNFFFLGLIRMVFSNEINCSPTPLPILIRKYDTETLNNLIHCRMPKELKTKRNK